MEEDLEELRKLLTYVKDQAEILVTASEAIAAANVALVKVACEAGKMLAENKMHPRWYAPELHKALNDWHTLDGSSTPTNTRWGI